MTRLLARGNASSMPGDDGSIVRVRQQARRACGRLFSLYNARVIVRYRTFVVAAVCAMTLVTLRAQVERAPTVRLVNGAKTRRPGRRGFERGDDVGPRRRRVAAVCVSLVERDPDAARRRLARDAAAGRIARDRRAGARDLVREHHSRRGRHVVRLLPPRGPRLRVRSARSLDSSNRGCEIERSRRHVAGPRHRARSAAGQRRVRLGEPLCDRRRRRRQRGARARQA